MDKVLIIEDDKTYLDNIKILLDEEGFNVVTAENGLDGIEEAKNCNPDIIICDIMLPDIDGYTVLKELRKREKTRLLPFVFLTAKAEMDDLRAGMNLGADDYVTKPFRANDLLAVIRTRLDKSRLIHNMKEKVISSNDKSRLNSDDFIFLPSKNNYEILEVDKVLFIASEGVYSKVYTINGKNILVRKLLKEWEQTLPEKIFIRIHKTSLINLKQVKKIEKWFNGALKIQLNNYPEPLIVSRRYAAKLKTL